MAELDEAINGERQWIPDCNMSTIEDRRDGRPMKRGLTGSWSDRTTKLAVAYLLLLTYALVTPRPLWVFGIAGDAAEESVDMTFSGFAQHAAAYAILAWLLLAAFGKSSRRARLWCVLFAVIHGILMEGFQYFVPLRYCDFPDAMANMVGVGIGWTIAIASSAVIHRCNSPSE